MAIFSAVPNNLTNGTTADATQVMADFNQIIANGNANAVAKTDTLAPAQVSLQNNTASLAGNVALNNTGTFFTGPSIAQGTAGTWAVWGTVTVQDNTSAAQIEAELTDGTTVIASTQGFIGGINGTLSLSLSGIIASPAGNLRILVKDLTTTNGLILANSEGAGNTSSRISAVRIG